MAHHSSILKPPSAGRKAPASIPLCLNLVTPKITQLYKLTSNNTKSLPKIIKYRAVSSASFGFRLPYWQSLNVYSHVHFNLEEIVYMSII